MSYVPCFPSSHQFIQSHGESLLVSFGFHENSDVYLFSSYVIDEIQFSFSDFGGTIASISITCSGPSVQTGMSDLGLDFRAARDLSVDELMKVVYNKLQQRSDS